MGLLHMLARARAVKCIHLLQITAYMRSQFCVGRVHKVTEKYNQIYVIFCIQYKLSLA